MNWQKCKARVRNALEPSVEIPPPTIPRRYTSLVDRDALILAELREIKELLKLIKDRL